MSAVTVPNPAVGVDVAAFAGPVLDADDWPAINVAGKRVAVLTSAACDRDVVAEIVRRADRAKVFHRHPVHVVPKVPLARHVARVQPVAQLVGRWHLRASVRDKELRRQLTPVRTTRVVMSSRWYRVLRRPNCQLISWPVTAVTSRGIRTADGLEHLVDIIVTA